MENPADSCRTFPYYVNLGDFCDENSPCTRTISLGLQYHPKFQTELQIGYENTGYPIIKAWKVLKIQFWKQQSDLEDIYMMMSKKLAVSFNTVYFPKCNGQPQQLQIFCYHSEYIGYTYILKTNVTRCAE
jgi:hypothetical protein